MTHDHLLSEITTNLGFCIRSGDLFSCPCLGRPPPRHHSFVSGKISTHFRLRSSENIKSLPTWFQKIFVHPNIALVLLEQPIRFLKATKTHKKFQRKFHGSANFRSVLVFFGFTRRHILAKNTPNSFINPLEWIQKLQPTQGDFQPRTHLSPALKNGHCSWITHAHSKEEKILPQDLSIMPPKAQKGFYFEEKMDTWDWTQFLTKHGTQQTWNHKVLNNPKLLPDFSPLYKLRKKWAHIPCFSVNYNDKMKHVNGIKEKQKAHQPKSSNFFCDYCSSTGHKMQFCDWLPNEREDWCQIHKDLYRFCREFPMLNLPAFGVNPSLKLLQEFMESIYRAEENFWLAFEKDYGHKLKEVPFPKLCWGNLSRRIGALQQLGTSPRFLADLLTGADLQFKMGPDGEPLKPPRFFVKPQRFSGENEFQFLKELEKGNKMHYLAPIPDGFWYSCENVFFRVSSGKPRFIQALEGLNATVRTPKFKLHDGIEIISMLHPLGFVITADIKNAYRSILIHPDAASKQVFCYVDKNNQNNFFMPRGMTFGLASNCAYCEAFFKNIICRVLCTLSPSLFSSNFLDDFICQVAIFSGTIDFRNLLPTKILHALCKKFHFIFNSINFVLFYCDKSFPIKFCKKQRAYISFRSLESFKTFYRGNLTKSMLPLLRDFESALIEAYTDGVRDFLFEFMGHLVPLNSKAQLKPTRTYKYLGFLSDLETQTLTPKVERIDKLVNLLTPVFNSDIITVESIQAVSGIFGGFKLKTVAFENLKYLLNKYLSSILRYLGPNADKLSHDQLTLARPCPPAISAAFLAFMHHTPDFEFSPLDANSKNISFHVTHPNEHYWPKASATRIINNIVDTSNYQVGCYTEFNGDLSYLDTSHLPPELMGDETQRCAFSASSTTRELYGILISLKRNQTFFQSIMADGLRIVCDNKAALWMIFSKKAKKLINQNLVNQIHLFLSQNITIPVELRWMRRSKYAVQAADYTSKTICHFSPVVTDYFKKELLYHFACSNPIFLTEIPEALEKIRSPHEPLGDFFPKSARVFVMTAPLNVAKAETLVHLVQLRRRNCVLVLPKIFGARYMDSLRKRNKFFFARYKNLFAGIPYLGFDAIVTYFEFV